MAEDPGLVLIVTWVSYLDERAHSPRLTIDVTYCNDDGEGFVAREEFVVHAQYNKPLLASIVQVLPESLLQDVQAGVLQCFEGHKKVSHRNNLLIIRYYLGYIHTSGQSLTWIWHK